MQNFIMFILCVIACLLLFEVIWRTVKMVSEKGDISDDTLDEILKEMAALNISQRELIEIIKEVLQAPPLEELNLSELKNIAHELEIKGYNKMSKDELIEAIRSNPTK